MVTNTPELMDRLSHVLEAIPKHLEDEFDTLEIESIILQLEDILSSEPSYEGMPLDVILGELSEKHSLDSGAAEAALELSDLSTRMGYDDHDDDEMLERGMAGLTRLQDWLLSLREALKTDHAN